MGLYKYLREAWKKPKKTLELQNRERLQKFRKQGVTVRVERPTRLDRARSLGYKAKTGVLIVRQRVAKGNRKRNKIVGGRRTAHSGSRKNLGKPLQVIAEERAARKYINCEVLNSYLVVEDGKHKWFEVIMADPTKLVNDKDLRWIVASQHKSRAFRGKTSAARKSRGLRSKGKGAEKIRRSGANRQLGKKKRDLRKYTR